MLNRDEMIVFEKKFSNINIITVLLLAVYYVDFAVFSRFNKAVEFPYMTVAMTMMIIEFILVRRISEKFDILLKISKYIVLIAFAISMIIISPITCSTILISMLYFEISIQAMFTFDITDSLTSALCTVYCVSPAIVCYVISLVIGSNSNLWFFVVIMSIVIFTLSIVNILQRLSEFCTFMYNKIFNLNDIATINQSENDKMKEYQTKLIQINEQLSIQKFQLESANNHITRNNNEMQLQYAAFKAINKELDTKKLISMLESIVVNDMDIDLCSCIIIDNSEFADEKILARSEYSRESSIGKGNTNILEKYAKQYIDNGAIIKFNVGAKEKFDALLGTNIETLIIYPIIISDNIEGLYIVGSTRENAFAENNTFLKNFSTQVTLGISNSMLYSRMKILATKDTLTGIYNRRYFNTIYSEYITKYKDNSNVITAILFDIDKFKKINDTYGHVFGDEVISYCGHIALKYAKNNDALPVRYGGEEFVMMFPDKNSSIVLDILEKMHDEIKQHEFINNGQIVKINISVGIATYPENCSDINQLVNSADNAMYSSKNNGRGRITIFN